MRRVGARSRAGARPTWWNYLGNALSALAIASVLTWWLDVAWDWSTALGAVMVSWICYTLIHGERERLTCDSCGADVEGVATSTAPPPGFWLCGPCAGKGEA